MFEHAVSNCYSYDLVEVLQQRSVVGWELVSTQVIENPDPYFFLFFKRPKQLENKVEIRVNERKATPAEISSVLRSVIALEPIRPNQIVCEGTHFVDDRVL